MRFPHPPGTTMQAPFFPATSAGTPPRAYRDSTSPERAGSATDTAETSSATGHPVPGPLVGLPDREPVPPQAAPANAAATKSTKPLPTGRLAEKYSRFFSPAAPADTALTTNQTEVVPAAALWRPIPPERQRFHELIDSIGKTRDGDRETIAAAIASRLVHAGVELPPRQHLPGTSLQILQGPHWSDALANGHLNIADTLAALRLCDEVDPVLRPELRRHLISAIETLVGDLAATHPGVRALGKSCAPAMRPMVPPPMVKAADPTPRMQAFHRDLPGLVHRVGAPDKPLPRVGLLATQLLECLRKTSNIEPSEEVELIGQVPAAVEALIQADATALRIAGPLREAARRIDAYLSVSACEDLVEPRKMQEGPGGAGLTEHKARRMLLNNLVANSLDPERLSYDLRSGDLHAWLHSTVVNFPERPGKSEQVLRVLRLALPAMLKNGLIDAWQSESLLSQTEAHFQAAGVPTT